MGRNGQAYGGADIDGHEINRSIGRNDRGLGMNQRLDRDGLVHRLAAVADGDLLGGGGQRGGGSPGVVGHRLVGAVVKVCRNGHAGRIKELAFIIDELQGCGCDPNVIQCFQGHCDRLRGRLAFVGDGNQIVANLQLTVRRQGVGGHGGVGAAVVISGDDHAGRIKAAAFHIGGFGWRLGDGNVIQQQSIHRDRLLHRLAPIRYLNVSIGGGECPVGRDCVARHGHVASVGEICLYDHAGR